ncbi:FadR/GntR family transcriptional regulator [Motiliproteus sp. MSK22-1]|uniref:FadR/GntR family transcriptional regulator n=1 Tax=Motiliproteus sp. MSK22-1 TaxID=1897630 RepID=UPI0009783224|nr:FCD domain-containing protein [Motiliproteus sp. MSK22-1]OMH38155.1 GntR family transcriptional regulator [Motiliproteus sp. MSK22-1]
MASTTEGNQDGVVHRVALELERRIVCGDICPGQKLPSQRKLAEDLGVSRSSVREAVQELQSKGLIETYHGGGSFSKNLLEGFYQLPITTSHTDQQLLKDQQFSSHDIQHQVMEMREILEGEAAYFAALRASDRQLEALSEEYQRMLRRSSGETTLKKAKADLRFHMMIAESSHHLLVISISQVMYSKYFNAIYGVLSRTLKKTGKYPPKISMQHADIYQAVIGRDARAARQAASEHIRYTRQQLTGPFRS